MYEYSIRISWCVCSLNSLFPFVYTWARADLTAFTEVYEPALANSRSWSDKRPDVMSLAKTCSRNIHRQAFTDVLLLLLNTARVATRPVAGSATGFSTGGHACGRTCRRWLRLKDCHRRDRPCEIKRMSMRSWWTAEGELSSYPSPPGTDEALIWLVSIGCHLLNAKTVNLLCQ